MRTGRHYVGFDTDAAYVGWPPPASSTRPAGAGAGRVEGPADTRTLADVAAERLAEAGAGEVARKVRIPALGVQLDLVAGGVGFVVCGSRTTGDAGLRRGDQLQAAVATAAVVRAGGGPPVALLTSALPTRGSPQAKALAAVTGPGGPVLAAIDVLADGAAADLAALYARPGIPGRSTTS